MLAGNTEPIIIRTTQQAQSQQKNYMNMYELVEKILVHGTVLFKTQKISILDSLIIFKVYLWFQF